MKKLPKYQPSFSSIRLILESKISSKLKKQEAVRFYRLFLKFIKEYKDNFNRNSNYLYYFCISDSKETLTKRLEDTVFVSLQKEEFEEIVKSCELKILKKKFTEKQFSFFKKNTTLYQDLRVKNLKVLFFKNIFVSEEGKEKNVDWIHLGTWKLISQLKRQNVKIILSDYNFSLSLQILKEELKNNKDLDFVGITLLEKSFLQTKKLISFIKKETDALIGVGGPMPTYSPEYVMVHLPEVNFVVRGEGEEIIKEITKTIFLLKEKYNPTEIYQYLALLDGILFFDRNVFVVANLAKVNYLNKTDGYELDFSFLTKRNVKAGLNLFTSRGCIYSCNFCTIVGKNYFRSQKLESVLKELDNYEKFLLKLYKNRKEIPKFCWGLSFYDDDFFIDVERAVKFFRYIKNSPFFINFIQTSINSFYIRKSKKNSDNLNEYLLESLTPDLFLPKEKVSFPKRFYIYIGTENFCERELRRLGKGYDFEKIYKVVKVLSEKKIYQAHHFIVANSFTQWEDLIDNLKKFIFLKDKFGEYFEILSPPIFNLTSLFPTFSYEKIRSLNGKFARSLKIITFLKKKGFPEFDYPIIEKDEPVDIRVKKFISLVQNTLNQDNYLEIFKKIIYGIYR
jgi:radical SAM superfamily enzyme YgiQ (UPF0313 family)